MGPQRKIQCWDYIRPKRTHILTVRMMNCRLSLCTAWITLNTNYALTQYTHSILTVWQQTPCHFWSVGNHKNTIFTLFGRLLTCSVLFVCLYSVNYAMHFSLRLNGEMLYTICFSSLITQSWWSEGFARWFSRKFHPFVHEMNTQIDVNRCAVFFSSFRFTSTVSAQQLI